MTAYAALLRGINVGGRRLVPMAALARVFAEAGCAEVATLIQSGNVVFLGDSKPEALRDSLEAAIAAKFGFAVPVVLRTAAELQKIVAAQPFSGRPQAALHTGFLRDLPDPARVAALQPAYAEGEEIRVSGREIYLHLPHGVARTKLTNAYFDAKLKTICTVRNWATTVRLAGLAAGLK